MSEPDENDDLPFTRSSIAAIGARRRWLLFGKDEDPEQPAGSSGSGDEPPTRGMLASLAEAAPSGPTVEPPRRNSLASVPETGPLARVPIDDEPPTHGMLASLSEAAPPGSMDAPPARGRLTTVAEARPPAPAPRDEPPTRGMLASLAELSPEPPAELETRRSVLSLDGAAVPQADDTVEPLIGPLTAHSTLAELAGLEEHVPRALPIERGVLISLAAHLLLVVLLITVPAHVAPDPKQGLLAAFLPAEKDTSPIPVIFQESPGEARANPKRSPLSDADRRASGGDPSRPRSASPFVPPSPGVAGLAPGPRSPRSPAREAARPGSAGAESRAALESSKSPEQKPSEFPTDMRPQLGSGPREISKLAGLDRAIQEAARSAVGGEGGAPPSNPDGGFVDSGPVSFDTKWYDWGPYGAEMVRRIKLHWVVPELARLGWKGSLTVRFFILADGSVADAKIIRVSGIPPFDFAALQAILTSSPFRPLPKDLNSTREGVTVTFFYNMRPEDGEMPGKSGKETP